MTYHSTRRKLFAFASSAALLGALMGAGLQSQAATPERDDTAGAEHRSPAQPSPHNLARHFWDALALEPGQGGDAWERLRASFQWQNDLDDPRVQAWIDHYRQSPQNVAEITERARHWLAYLVGQVEERGLPGEIALIPFIESSFDPGARSHRGAAGLWQFMPGTGDALGLSRQQGYDGRLDVVASTAAALDYIEEQADQWYGGDIQLSLAAYNAGAGTVNRARQAAKSQGKSGDYWSLSLPQETMNYLPKLKAIAAIIADPEEHDVALPEIEDAPAFAEVPVDQPLRLDEAARMAGVPQSTLAELNPGVTGGAIQPGEDRVLLVPSESSAEELMASLESPEPAAPKNTADPAGGERYVVQQGDTLEAIASRQGVGVDELRQANDLSGDNIRTGQALSLPTRSLASR